MREKTDYRPVKYYIKDIETLYKTRFNSLVRLAGDHVYNRDLAVDVVHSVLEKAINYFNNHPDRKVRINIINIMIIRECKKVNKQKREIPMGLMNQEHNGDE